jgi:hypothetical protein
MQPSPRLNHADALSGPIVPAASGKIRRSEPVVLEAAAPAAWPVPAAAAFALLSAAAMAVYLISR